MKHTTRKMTAVLLALSLLVGMMTLFSASASAASNLTVQVTSNLPALFPDADIAMDESTKMVKVTYYINTPDYKIMNCEWTLEYDGTKLTPELRTGGLNVDIDEKGEITSYRFMRFAKNLSGQIINTDPLSYRNKENGVRAIIGNASSAAGFKDPEGGKKEFITAYFKINAGAAGSAKVNLLLKTMQACPVIATGSAVVQNTVSLVKKNEVNYNLNNVYDILPQLDPENHDEYCSSAEEQPAPISVGYALSLSDSIQVKTQVINIPAENSSGYSVDITFKNQTSHKNLVGQDGQSKVMVLADTNALEMTEPVHMVLRDGNNKVVRVRDLSVLGYCEQIILTDGYSDILKNLCRAVLNYGAESQKFFNEKLDNLPNKNPALACDTIPLAESIPEEYQLKIESDPGFPENLQIGYTLALNTKTKLDILLCFADGKSFDGYSFQLIPPTGATAVWTIGENSHGNKEITISKISSFHLSDTFTLSVKAPDNRTREYKISAFSYVFKAQGREQENVVKAMYKFYELAKLLP